LRGERGFLDSNADTVFDEDLRVIAHCVDVVGLAIDILGLPTIVRTEDRDAVVVSIAAVDDEVVVDIRQPLKRCEVQR
jgi:hypothetical protein